MPRPSGRDTTGDQPAPAQAITRNPLVCREAKTRGGTWSMFQKTTWPASGGQEWRRAGPHWREMWDPPPTLSLQSPQSLEVCPHVTRFLDDTNWMA